MGRAQDSWCSAYWDWIRDLIQHLFTSGTKIVYVLSIHLTLSCPLPTSILKQGLCVNLEGWDGEGDGKEVQKGADVCIPVADSC